MDKHVTHFVDIEVLSVEGLRYGLVMEPGTFGRRLGGIVMVSLDFVRLSDRKSLVLQGSMLFKLDRSCFKNSVATPWIYTIKGKVLLKTPTRPKTTMVTLVCDHCGRKYYKVQE